MKRALLPLSLFLALAMPVTAEEIALKNGTKIVGRMSAISGDKIEVETPYGKMALNRADIVSIEFPENAPSTAAKDNAPVPNIEESLRGALYANKTAKFTLAVPPDWKIDPKLPHSAVVVAGLSSKDGMRYLTVSQEEFNGSMESYKGLLDLKYRKSFGSYEELSESPVNIDGKSALLLSFRGVLTKADNTPVQYLVAIIPSGNTYTRVATWCVEPLFHETQPMFEKIVTSYRATGSTSAEVRK